MILYQLYTIVNGVSRECKNMRAFRKFEFNECSRFQNLEYGRYLSEVVKILETDKEFAKKLENVSQDDIRVSIPTQVT